MASGPTVEVEGARQLRAGLKKAGADLNDLKTAHAAVAALVTAAAKGRAPKKTGRLAGSIRGSKAKTSVTIRAGGASLPYAGPIHWGWPARNIAANPFISDAATSTESQWVALYFKEIESIVGKIKGA